MRVHEPLRGVVIVELLNGGFDFCFCFGQNVRFSQSSGRRSNPPGPLFFSQVLTISTIAVLNPHGKKVALEKDCFDTRLCGI